MWFKWSIIQAIQYTRNVCEIYWISKTNEILFQNLNFNLILNFVISNKDFQAPPKMLELIAFAAAAIVNNKKVVERKTL